MTQRTVAILAGGLGTRVATLTGGTMPKAMLPIAGAPFIDHKLNEAVRLGATRVVLLLGHGAEQIVEHVNANEPHDTEIVMEFDGPDLLGTGGSLRRAAHQLGPSPWVTYGDTLLDADLDAAERLAASMDCASVLTVLHNQDRWEPSNTTVIDGRVHAYSKNEPPGTHAYIDYGYLQIPTAAVTAISDSVFDLRQVLLDLIEKRQVAAYEVSERFHDIGTPDRLAETDQWLRSKQRSTS